MTTADEAQRTQVIVAGAGAVGMALAVELGIRGVDCILLNDQPTTATHPKANAISSRTMEHLRRFGIAAGLRECGLDPDHPTDVTYVTRLNGLEIGRFRQPSRAEALRLARQGEGDWPSPEPPHRCSQIYLEGHLKERIDGLPSVDARFGWRLEGFEDRGDQVVARIRDMEHGSEATLSADYLVGCDGGASLVRKALGIELEGESGPVRPMMGGPMYATYFRVDTSVDWLPAERAWQYWIVHPEIRALLIHVDRDDAFLFHFALPPGTGHADVDPAGLIRRAVGTDIPVEILSSVNWTAGYSLVAQRYGAGRVFIAGDAAHLFTPTGGMGMNTGVDDAVNLGWKLAAVLQGWGGPALLGSYEAERRPVGLRNVGFARGFADSVGKVPVTAEIEADSPAGREERAALKRRFEEHARREFVIPGIFLGLQYAGSPVIEGDGTDPPPDHPNDYVPDGFPGARAPHLWLAPGEALHDRLGLGFTLLRFATGPGDASDTAGFEALQAAAAERDIPFEILDVAKDEGAALYGARLALVRPDQHVAWRGGRLPGDCGRLLDRVTGRVTGR